MRCAMSEKATRRRGSALEEAILDAAWDVLETDGWNGFTFAGVAERAHSSKLVLYRRVAIREARMRVTLRWRGETSPGAGWLPCPRRGWGGRCRAARSRCSR